VYEGTREDYIRGIRIIDGNEKVVNIIEDEVDEIKREKITDND